MDHLYWIFFIGLLLGFISGRLFKLTLIPFLINLIIGVVGAYLGGWLYHALGLNLSNENIGILLTSLIGGLFLIYFTNSLKKTKSY